MVSINVGIFTDTYLPTVNGVVTSVITLKEKLENMGHDVFIITVKGAKISKNKENVIRIPGIKFPSLPEHKIAMIYSYKLINKIKKLKLDIIHTQTEFSAGLFGRLISKLYNIPVVHTYHTMYEDYVHYLTGEKFKKITSNLAKKMSQLYCRNCDRLIAPSKKTKEALESYGLNRHIDIIPTGINLENFKRKLNIEEIKEIRNELDINKDTPTILYIGRLAKEKSIDLIIRNIPLLLEKIPESKFLIIGDGPEKINLQKLSKKLSLENNIIFAGEKPWKDIHKYYEIGDLFVNASTTETQGLTFIEAMASGLPVIARYDKN